MEEKICETCKAGYDPTDASAVEYHTEQLNYHGPRRCHYQRAEELIAQTENNHFGGPELDRYNLTLARIHATLAQAAATAMAGFAEDGMTLEDWNEWNAAAGVDSANFGTVGSGKCPGSPGPTDGAGGLFHF